MKIENGANGLHNQGDESTIEQISRIKILDTTILSLFSIVMLATTLIAIAALGQMNPELGGGERDQNSIGLQVAQVNANPIRRFSSLIGNRSFAWDIKAPAGKSGQTTVDTILMRGCGGSSDGPNPLRGERSVARLSVAGRDFSAPVSRSENNYLARRPIAYLGHSAATTGSVGGLSALGSDSWSNTSDIFDPYMISTIY
jgi:hypothetical protein